MDPVKKRGGDQIRPIIFLLQKSLDSRPGGACLILQVDGDVKVLKAPTTNSPIPD